MVDENQEIIERYEEEMIVLDKATKNLNLFIQMIHQIIIESRSNFKNKIELTFYQSPDLPDSADNPISKAKPTVQPRIDKIQSLINKFKENGFEILELFGEEISIYFIKRNINNEIENDGTEGTIEGEYNFEIIKGYDPSFYRIIIHLPKLNQTQIIENSNIMQN